MSTVPTAPQETFAFTPENLAKAKAIIAKYPEGRQASATIPLLDLAQRQVGNHLTLAAMNYVAELLSLPPIRVYETANFYTMFYKEKVGTHHVQVCATTPCWLRGSDAIVKTCKDKLGIGVGETTADGQFSLQTVECLGACVNAPMVQINDNFFEDLTPEIMARILDDLKAGNLPPVGSQTGRRGSCAQNGSTSLKDQEKSHA